MCVNKLERVRQTEREVHMCPPVGKTLFPVWLRLKPSAICVTADYGTFQSEVFHLDIVSLYISTDFLNEERDMK